MDRELEAPFFSCARESITSVTFAFDWSWTLYSDLKDIVGARQFGEDELDREF